MTKLNASQRSCVNVRAYSFGLAAALLSILSNAASAGTPLERGTSAIRSMTGCYLVDYSYTETNVLVPNHPREERVYDVNKNKSIKEWIYAEDISERHIRLQHILFGVDLNGKVMEGSELRHQAEDWEFDATFLYDFVAPAQWSVKDLKATPGIWTRKITNLDDGPRYQCAAEWAPSTAFPEWACDNYAPIPGRETRDMQRKDYNTLQRSTRVVAYGNSWLERQTNIKTIDRDGTKTPLAQELGKNWYVRLPDTECAPVQSFAQARRAFWGVLREAWAETLIGDRPFIEKTIPGKPSRYFRILELEEASLNQDLSVPTNRRAMKDAILKIIQEYRAN